MIVNSKILGQLKPTSGTLGLLYIVPNAKESQGIIVCCNQATTKDHIHIGFVKSGDNPNLTQQFVCFNTAVPANGVLEKSFDLGPDESLYVYSLNGTSSFVATGLEISNV